MRPRSSWLVAAAALAAGSACWTQDPHADETERRLAALEQQVATQQRELENLQRVVTASPEQEAMAHQLAELQGRVQALQQPSPPRAAPYRRQLDRNAMYAVPIAGYPTFGPPSAKVTMVMAEDFACPFCRRAWDTVDQLRQQYGSDLRVVYRPFVVHPQVATYPAEAACAANHQGADKWRAFADLVWTQAFDTHDFDPAHIDDLARQAGLDMARYRADLTGLCPGEVQRGQAELAQLGVAATPSFFINGRYLAGALPIASFRALIDEEMAKADAAIQGGMPADRYYDQVVLGNGLHRPAAAP